MISAAGAPASNVSPRISRRNASRSRPSRPALGVEVGRARRSPAGDRARSPSSASRRRRFPRRARLAARESAAKLGHDARLLGGVSEPSSSRFSSRRAAVVGSRALLDEAGEQARSASEWYGRIASTRARRGARGVRYRRRRRLQNVAAGHQRGDPRASSSEARSASRSLASANARGSSSGEAMLREHRQRRRVLGHQQERVVDGGARAGASSSRSSRSCAS